MKSFDFSSLFGGMSSGSLFGSVDISEYASIKSGSYKKLLKSYYAEQKDTSSTSKAASSTSKETSATKKSVVDKILDEKKKVTPKVDNSGAIQVKREADSLIAAADALNSEELWEQTNCKYDMEKIANAVKTFVNEYNDTLTQTAKMTSKDVSQDVKYMNSMTGTMSKSLEKIGITLGIDGKLTVNEDTLKNADVSKIKSLFVGKVSYGSQIADKAASISKDAVLSSSIYGSNGMLLNSLSGLFDKTV